MSVARSSVSRRVRRMRSRRSSPCTPNTARMITSSVTACMRGHSANGSPRGQVSISWRATEAIRSPYARIRSPWNGGSSSLRWDMWRSSSSSSTELWPSSGSRIALASPACSSRGSPLNTCWTSSGLVSITQSPSWAMRTVKLSP